MSGAGHRHAAPLRDRPGRPALGLGCAGHRGRGGRALRAAGGGCGRGAVGGLGAGRRFAVTGGDLEGARSWWKWRLKVGEMFSSEWRSESAQFLVRPGGSDPLRSLGDPRVSSGVADDL